MATNGNIVEYDESKEWTQYVERMDHYFEANEIEENDEKRSIFRSVAGAIIRGLITPATPNDKTYKELTEIIKNHWICISDTNSIFVLDKRASQYLPSCLVRTLRIWKYAGRNAERSVSLWRKWRSHTEAFACRIDIGFKVPINPNNILLIWILCNVNSWMPKYFMIWTFI